MPNVLNGFDQQPDTVPVSLPGIRSIDALLSATRWATPGAGPLVLSYSFPYANGGNAFFAAGSDYSLIGEPQSSFGLNAVQRQAVRDALAEWSSIANVQFVEVAESNTSAGVLRFAWTNKSQGSAAAWAYEPNDFFASGGDVWLGARSSLGLAQDKDWLPGGNGYAVLLHEIGHALGLKHPFEDTPTLGADDSEKFTLMSYTPHPNGLFLQVTQTGTRVSTLLYEVQPDTPMPYDVAAMQYLYGVNTLATAGDDTYTVQPDVPFIRTLWDAAGTDTLSAAGFARGVRIDLRPGSYSSLTIPSQTLPSGFTFTSTPPEPTYDGTDNLAIAAGTVIENAIGGAGDDTLTGNDANNRLQGGAGNDRIDGGAGIDTAVLAATRAGVRVDVSGTTITVNGSEGNDTLLNIERLQFADRKLALDLALNGNAAQAALALGVVFPSGVTNPQILGLALSLADAGRDATGIVQWVNDNGILAQLAGSAQPADVARMAVRNVLKTTEPSMVDLALSFMDGRNAKFTPVQFLGFVAGLDVNQQAIGLVGLQQIGLEFA